jgi:hypothetical protein
VTSDLAALVKRIAPAFLCALTFAAPVRADTTGPWDVKALQTADVKPEWGDTTGLVREVYYPECAIRGVAG